MASQHVAIDYSLGLPVPIWPEHTAEGMEFQQVAIDALGIRVPKEPEPEPKPFDPSPEEKSEMKRKAEVLAVPTAHSGVLVSRGHAELEPYTLKPIFQDSIDLMIYSFAKWAFVAQGEPQTSMIKKILFDHLKNFQSITDHADGRPIGHASQNGHDIGRMIARRGFQIGLEWLVPAIGHFFLTMQELAEEKLSAMGPSDYVEYDEWGAGSWIYTQLMERLFFQHARMSCDKEMRKRQALADGGEVADVESEGGEDQEGELLIEEDYVEDSEYMGLVFRLARNEEFEMEFEF